MSTYEPRPSQQSVIAYAGGRMGVSAVPGSGKTHTLAELAAKFVAESIGEDQEVLVVTLANAAVDNLKGRINNAIKRRRLLPGLGYRVRTLHGLCHDIVRERPGLVGLSEDFEIIDEQAAEAVRHDATDAWLASHADAADPHLLPGMSDGRIAWIKKGPWRQLVHKLVSVFIKRAKDSQIGPDQLAHRIEDLRGVSSGERTSPFLDLAAMATAIYSDYQDSLAYRGKVDFDDLVRLALAGLQRDNQYLTRLQLRWPFVLEDEAQDSSMLQEEILRLLSSRHGNWVRVGDPNQAIYATFTTAKPDLLQLFVQGVGSDHVRELPVSGRSQPGIIRLANYLIDWVRSEHPLNEARTALVETHIAATEPGDPQPNPPIDLDAVQILCDRRTPSEELRFVAARLSEWSSKQQGRAEADRETCAVLAPTNQRGAELAGHLRQLSIPYVELLQSTTATRETAGALGRVLRCLADPVSSTKLASAFRVWRKEDRGQADAEARIDRCAQAIARCQRIEAYLWPRAGDDWCTEVALGQTALDLGLLT